MAVEARHLHLFPPQLIPNREIMNTNVANPYNTTQMVYNSSVLPLSGTTETLAPAAAAAAAYNNSFMADSVAQKASESGITYNNVPLPRKRPRDSSIHYPILSYPATNKNNCGYLSFLGEDITHQIHQQQHDIDRLIAHHMEKVRMEIEEREARSIIEGIGVGMMKRLRAKEEEIEKMGKLNWALEERVKSLCIENQIWRDLAQTNEATANALRTNLEQVLMAQVKKGPVIIMEDAESCCGSSGEDDNDEEEEEEEGNNESRRLLLCRKCGKEESCVLILPCRHLCLCTVCGSTIHTCPVCKSFKNASVHVNMS